MVIYSRRAERAIKRIFVSFVLTAALSAVSLVANAADAPPAPPLQQHVATPIDASVAATVRSSTPRSPDAPVASSSPPLPAAAPATPGRAGEASLAELLGAKELDYGKGVRCIPSRHVQDTEVLSQNLIVFRDRQHIWVNQIAGRCPQLTPEAIISLEKTEQNRHCNLDIVRVLHDDGPSLFGGENIAIGPACMLGKFEPISRAQLDVLREHYTPHSPELEKHVLKGKAK